MVYYLQLLSGCQTLCLLALNIRYQHSCLMVWEMFEPLLRTAARNHVLSTGISVNVSHGNARIWSSLSFNLFSHIERNTYILFILWVTRESLSLQDEMWQSTCIVFTAYSNNCSIFNWSQAVWHWLLWPRYWTSNNF